MQGNRGARCGKQSGAGFARLKRDNESARGKEGICCGQKGPKRDRRLSRTRERQEQARTALQEKNDAGSALQ